MAGITTPKKLTRYAEFYHQLGVMLSAGVPLIKALDMAGKHRGSKIPFETLQKLNGHLQSGMTFGESLRQMEDWLPEFDVSLLQVGEKSGRLDVTFKQLAEYYNTRAKIIRDTISGLIITVATLHVFLLIFPLGLFIKFAMGIISGPLTDCLPFVIEKIVVFGGSYALVFGLIYACQGNRGIVWRGLTESLFQAIPVLRTALKYLTLSRLAAALEALVTAGIPIVQGWEMAAAACGSTRLRSKIADWRGPLAGGITPAELVNESDYFPEMFANLYATGEQSGQLDETLRRLKSYYQEEGFRTLRFFTRLMNGVIYGLIAALVGFYIITFWVHYFHTALNAAE